jgi:cysteine-rich repeat protein
MKRTAPLCSFICAVALVLAATSSSAFGDDAGADIVWPSVGSRPADLQTPEQAPLGRAARIPRAAAGVSPGVAFGFSGPDAISPIPPDTHIAVGLGAGTAGRVVVVTNGGFQLFDKNGASLAGPMSPEDFTSSADNAFDPKVLFDQHSGRFFIVVLEGNTPDPGGTSNVHIAVSTSSAPSNLTTDWTKTSGSALTTVGITETWFDYPSIGADDDSLFVTGNLFDENDSFQGTKIRVFDKQDLLAGSYTFTDIDTTASSGSTIQPAHVYGTTDSGDFYLVNRISSDSYRLWQITGDPASPTLVGNDIGSWSAGFQVFSGAPQMGSSVTLDTLSARVINAVYRDGHVWLTLSSDGDSDGRTEAFWAKIATNGGLPSAPTVADSGFIDGSDGDEWTFLPSINVNASEDVGICYTQSGGDQFPEMRFAARRAFHPAGSFLSSIVAADSPGFWDSFADLKLDRWGDYSASVVDPDDDATFWIANEVVHTSSVDNSRWGTFIAEIGPFTCPNGIVDPGEECDDDNTADGDGCDVFCAIEECFACSGEPSSCSPDTAGACDDGDPCTENDLCSGLGECAGSFPLAGCLTPDVAGRSILVLKNKSSDGLIWKWKKGTTSKASFLDPVAGTQYQLCIYDAVDGPLMGLTVPAGPLWEEKPKGFKYVDKTVSSDGVKKVLLKEGTGNATILIKGKGAGLNMTTLGTALDLPLTVQLTNGTTCWETTYENDVTKNRDDLFKAKND